MNDRIPLDDLTSDQLDALYAELDRLTAELADYDQRVQQTDDLLRIAHDTSNKSETERALAVQRAERAEAERDHLAAAASPADVAVQLMQETGKQRDRYKAAWHSARRGRERIRHELTVADVAYQHADHQYVQQRQQREREANRALLAQDRAERAEAAHAQTIASMEKVVRRARRAEAAIERVRALAERLNDELASDADKTYARAILTALDQPAPAAAPQATDSQEQ